MDHPCHKCGQPVEDGIPFCSHCGGPQIRVIRAEPAPAAVISEDEAVISSGPVVLENPGAGPVFLSQTLRPCALAALVAVLLMNLGLNPFVAMFGAGVLAVVFYRQRGPAVMIRTGTGARLGALCGLLWFAISAILESLIVVVLHKGPEIRNAMLEKMQQVASQTNDPQVLAVLDYMKTPAGFTVMMAASIVCAFFASIVLAAIGGALGGAFFARRDRS